MELENKLLKEKLAKLEDEKTQAIGEIITLKRKIETRSNDYQQEINSLLISRKLDKSNYEQTISHLQKENASLLTDKKFALHEVYQLSQKVKHTEKTLKSSQSPSQAPAVHSQLSTMDTPSPKRPRSNNDARLNNILNSPLKIAEKQTQNDELVLADNSDDDLQEGFLFDVDTTEKSNQNTHNERKEEPETISKNRTNGNDVQSERNNSMNIHQTREKKLRGGESENSHSAKNLHEVMAQSFRDGFADAFPSSSKRKRIESRPNLLLKKASNARPLFDNDMINQNVNNINSNDGTATARKVFNNTPFENYLAPNRDIKLLLEKAEGQISSLKGRLVGIERDSIKNSKILQFYELLLNNNLYGSENSSWDILSKLTIKVQSAKGSGTVHITRILEVALFNTESSQLSNSNYPSPQTFKCYEDEKLSSICNNFFKTCETVIFACLSDFNYRPIPIILQLIHYTIDYYPPVVISSSRIIAFLCEFIKRHLPYIKSIPDADAIYKRVYNPFNISNSLKKKRVKRPSKNADDEKLSISNSSTSQNDSSISCNDAFKEMSILFAFDVLQNAVSYSDYISTDSHSIIWQEIPFSLINLLLESSVPSNFLLRIVLMILFSVTETTVGPIHPDLPLVKNIDDKISLTSKLKEPENKNEISNDKQYGDDDIKMADNNNNNTENEGQSTSFDNLNAFRIQARNESELVSAFAILLTENISSKHTLLFSGLENFPSSIPECPFFEFSSFAKKAKNFPKIRPPRKTVDYIYYGTINSFYPNPSSSSSKYFPPPLRFHQHVENRKNSINTKNTEKYHHEISQINFSTTIFLRRMIIKAYILIAITKTPQLIVQNTTAMISIIHCLSNYVEIVYQSVEPDNSLIEFISDCVILLHNLWFLNNMIVSGPDFPLEDSVTTRAIMALPHNVGSEFVITMSKIGFSEGPIPDQKEKTSSDVNGKPSYQEKPLFRPIITKMARDMVRFNVASKESEFIWAKMGYPNL